MPAMPARIEFLSADFRARRGGRLGLCAVSDFRALCSAHGLGGISRFSSVSPESAAAARFQGQGTGGRRCSPCWRRSSSCCRLSALSVEFAAQISTLLRSLQNYATQLDIKSLSDLQQFPIDRPRQRLAAGAHRNLRGAGAVLADFRLAGNAAARREHGRLVLSGCVGLAGVICRHVVAAVLFPAGRRFAAGPRAPLDSARRGTQGSAVQAVGRCDARHRLRHGRHGNDSGSAARHRLRHRHLPSPVVFGVLATLLSMLPVGGSAFVWGPAAIWAVLSPAIGVTESSW